MVNLKIKQESGIWSAYIDDELFKKSSDLGWLNKKVIEEMDRRIASRDTHEVRTKEEP